VEEGEEKYDLGIDAIRRAGERETVLAHALPMRKPVEGGRVRGRAGENHVENVRREGHRVSLDLSPGDSDDKAGRAPR